MAKQWHPTENGKFNDVTYARVVELTAWLCDEFGLDEKDVIRHHDVTGKLCPLYYVEHEDAGEQMRKDIKKAIIEITNDIEKYANAETNVDEFNRILKDTMY